MKKVKIALSEAVSKRVNEIHEAKQEAERKRIAALTEKFVELMGLNACAAISPSDVSMNSIGHLSAEVEDSADKRVHLFTWHPGAESHVCVVANCNCGKVVRTTIASPEGMQAWLRRTEPPKCNDCRFRERLTEPERPQRDYNPIKSKPGRKY